MFQLNQTMSKNEAKNEEKKNNAKYDAKYDVFSCILGFHMHFSLGNPTLM